MDRNNLGIHGVYVLTKDMTKDNIEYWKNGLIKEYETADQYGKGKTVEFKETVEDNGSRYINFWVS